VWDAEKRLVQMETTAEAVTAGVPFTRLKFQYDWNGHRLARHVWKGGTSTSPTFQSSTRWLWDGWNPVAEYTATSATSTTLTLHATYVWGLDLSGSLQGAGGVGGLLAAKVCSPSSSLYYPSFDGNGNIVAWTVSGNTSPSCLREYDAFGNVVVEQGTPLCGFGFSTKIEDPETGLVYYGLRYYQPPTGRWPSRDPIEEDGGANLYGFTKNNPCDYYDYLGQDGGSVLTLKFRKDSSVDEDFYAKPVPNQTSVGAMRYNQILEQISFLKTKLNECSKKANCGAKDKIPEVISDLDGLLAKATVQPKEPISNTPQGIKNFDDWAGKTVDGVVPVTITKRDLRVNAADQEVGGRAGKNSGILLSIQANQPTLAHELGHVGGYKITGDRMKDEINGQHRTGEGYIMSEVAGEKIDDEWCKVVIELAKKSISP